MMKNKIVNFERTRLLVLTPAVLSLVFLTFVFLSLFSCTKEVMIDIPGYKEQLVVDGQIETGQPPFVLLSRSKDIYAPTDFNSFLGSFVSGAIVTMSDGTTTYTLQEVCTDNLPPGAEQFAADLFGIPVSEISNYHLCGYTSFDPNTFGQVGKTYTLNIEFEGKSYSGSTQIVQPTALDSVYWKPQPDLSNYGYSYAFLSDPLGGYDAYKWEVKRLNTVNGEPVDTRFKPTYSPVFDDEFIDGKSFEFFYENPMSYDDENLPDNLKGYYKQGDTVVIKFSKMDRYVYEFMISKYTQLQTNGNPFASPTNIVSNLSGGCLGVWAGYSPTFDTLICQP